MRGKKFPVNNHFVAQFPVSAERQQGTEGRQDPVKKKADDDDSAKEQINRPAFPFPEELIA